MTATLERATGPGWAMELGDSFTWLAREAEPESVDAFIMDPPYSSGGQYRGDRTAPVRDKYQNSNAAPEYPEFYGDTRDQRGYLAWCSLWLADAWRCARPQGVLVVFSDWRMLPTMTDAVQAGGWVWRGIAPWAKPNARRQLGRFAAQCEYAIWGSKGPMPFERGVGALPGFFVDNSVPSEDRQHLTEKPEAVMREIVKICTPGGLICDPFCGAVTTGIEAVRAGYLFLGRELSADYFRISCERFRSLENHEHRKDHERGQIGLFAGQPKEQSDGE